MKIKLSSRSSALLAVVLFSVTFSSLTFVKAQSTASISNPKQVAKPASVKESNKSFSPGKEEKVSQKAEAGNKSPIKFEVLFIRFMNEEELARRGHNRDPDMVMEFSISNTSDQPVYYYTDFVKHFKDPSGYTVKETDSGVVWLIRIGTESLKSPGLREYSHGGWITLAPGATLEWEYGEMSGENVEQHARTMFIKDMKTGVITEIFSDFYTVPATSHK